MWAYLRKYIPHVYLLLNELELIWLSTDKDLWFDLCDYVVATVVGTSFRYLFDQCSLGISKLLLF